MRTVLGFFSMLAAGFLIAAWIAVAGTGPNAQFPNTALHPGQGFTIDYPSLLLGLAIGLILPAVAGFSWSALPRRFLTWLWSNEHVFYHLGIAAALVGVLVFY